LEVEQKMKVAHFEVKLKYLWTSGWLDFVFLRSESFGNIGNSFDLMEKGFWVEPTLHCG
jgi:hypothetical protein